MLHKWPAGSLTDEMALTDAVTAERVAFGPIEAQVVVARRR